MGFERILRRLLEYGVLAPSIYNSQPWKFSIDPKRGIIGVYADEERARPVKPKTPAAIFICSLGSLRGIYRFGRARLGV